MLVPLTNVACVNANWSYNNFALGYCVSVDEELNDVIYRESVMVLDVYGSFLN